MTEIVLNTNTLPEPLFHLIHTERVKVNESDGIINLIPIADADDKCPLCGLTADSGLTVEKFLAMTHNEMEMGQ